MAQGYANPEVLVSTEWLEQHLEEVRVVEVDADPAVYWEGHVPGAAAWSWKTQLSDPLRRDILSREQIERLLGQTGIEKNTTVVLYGDSGNWFAAWAYWQLKIYGHEDVRLLDGGRNLWVAEGRKLEIEEPVFAETMYLAEEPNWGLRAYLRQVQDAEQRDTEHLVDVRSKAEYRGEIAAPEGSTETSQRAGHIPGAKHVFWAWTIDEKGKFRSREELEELFGKAGVVNDRPVITYCRIGERSSHTWFVLKYLLGYDVVRNYDGSWTEWGNLVGAPVARAELYV